MDTAGAEPFGSLLRRLRERARLTQEQLAEKAGLSANAVSALERGERRHPYPNTVRSLAAALGLDAEELRVLRDRVPRRERPAAAPSGLPVPRQLPAVPRDFTGRVADLARLDELLRPDRAEAPSAVVISTIDGTAGVGKTTLALVWARRVRDRFPDGQLYVNLRGYDPGAPAAPAEVLDGFLRALDVPADKIPPTVPERAALFRSLLDGRRVLVVLDNAGSAEQVRPLLPGSPSCLAVVTSRASLAGLAVSVGAVRIGLDRLPLDDAVALLRAIVGAPRADREPEAVVELARSCARLPLALRLAGRRAVARPRARLADVVAELADEAERLELFSAEDDEFTAVRPVFSWSYRRLPADQARVFRLLGLHAGPDIGVHAVAALAGTSPARARRLLDGLADANLVELADRDRFTLHDLLRAYAREQAETGDTAEFRHEAVRRLVGYYLHTATAADQALHPGRPHVTAQGAPAPGHPVTFAGYDDALAWYEVERAALPAVCDLAARTGLSTAAWELPWRMWGFFQVRKYSSDWVHTHRTGLDAARGAGDRYGEARMHNGLGGAYVWLRRLDEAVEHFREALRLFREVGDRWGEGSALGNLGDAHLVAGRFAESVGYSTRALAIFGETGNPYMLGVALGNLGEAHLGLHRYEQAHDHFVRVLELCRRIDHRHGENLTLIHLGEAALGLGRYDEAVDHLTLALDLSHDTGSRHNEGVTLDVLGQVHAAAGRPEAARRCWEAALRVLTGLDDRRADELRARLGPGQGGGEPESGPGVEAGG